LVVLDGWDIINMFDAKIRVFQATSRPTLWPALNTKAITNK